MTIYAINLGSRGSPRDSQARMVPVPTDKRIDPPVEMGQLDTGQYQRLRELVAPFEHACQDARDDHTLVDMASFLPPVGEPLYRAVLLELVKIDLEYRWVRHQPARLEEYVIRFPDLGPADELPVHLIHEEYVVRQRFGDLPTPDEYRERFPKQFDRLCLLFGEEPALTLVPTALSDSGTKLARLLSCRYELKQELGRGGMGVVYKAIDHKHNRLVALKTMHGLDPTALLRFNNEFRALVDLRHPNLVTLYELAADGDRRYFTMELVIGVDLLAHVREPAEDTPVRETPQGEATTEDVALPPITGATPLTPDQMLRLRHTARQLAEAVLYLHDAGRAHRDIKPRNVLVSPNGIVKLLDFGLAVELDRDGLHQSTEPHVLGTVAYMAPEQADSQPTSPATDWYAVGVMLFEALTGCLPFDGRPLEILKAKVEREAPAPADLVAGVPDDLNRLTVDLLRRDPAARPNGRDVLSRLQPGAPPPPPPSSAAPFVGRQRHLDVLHDAFQEVRDGRPRTIYVQGRSGVGKTALVQRFLDELVKGGKAVVLRGRCYEQESVPYKALDNVIDALTRYLRRQPAAEAKACLPRDVAALARVFPALETVPAIRTAPRRDLHFADPQELRRRAVVALREMLARLGDQQPLVVAIDDLQWGDGDSAVLLRELTQPPDAPVMLLLGCYRSEDAETSPCLRVLLRPPETGQVAVWKELIVGALTVEECKELALSLLHQSGPGANTRAEVIARDSGGNPFFVCELAQHFQTTPNGDGAAEAPKGDTALNEVLWARVLRLPEQLRRLLEVVAVAGRPLRFEDACKAAGETSDQREAVAVLRAGRLVRSTATASCMIETYHDRIRETVSAHLDPETRRHHHLRLAEVLEEAGSGDFEALAVHYRAAGVSGKAFRFATLAADKAAQALAFTRAAHLYRLALELGLRDGTPEERRLLRVRLAEALANAGRGTEAAREYLAAAPDASPPEQRELQRRAALHLLRNGQIDHGLAVLEQVAANAGFQIPSARWRCLCELLALKARLWLRGLRYEERPAEQSPPELLAQVDACFAVALGLILVEPFRGAAFATRGLLLGMKAGEPYRLALTFIAEGFYCAVGGTQNSRSRARLLDMAQELADKVKRADLDAVLLVARVGIAAAEGSWVDARRMGDQAEALIRESCSGLGAELAVAQHFTLRALSFLGDLPEVTRRLPAVLHEAHERDDLYSLTNNTLEIQTFVHLAADEPERARAGVASVLDRWSRRGYHEQHLFHLMAECHIDLYQGRPDLAWDRLNKQWSVLQQSMLLVVQQLRVFVSHLRGGTALALALKADRPEPLRAVARREARSLQRERADWATALGLLLESALTSQEGDRDRAVAALERAVTQCRKTSMRLHEAAALRRLGQLRGTGSSELAEGNRLMLDRGIKDPERMTTLLVPGF